MPTDLLLLGATGFTGKLITQYLTTHPERSKFSLTLAARSKARLDALVSSLHIDSKVQELVIDVTKPEEVDSAIKNTKVVINTVGPFWKWGTPVIAACVKHSVHYVDLTGETPWIRDIIDKFDYAATKNRAIIIPSCGMDSIPSDVSAFLSALTIRRLTAPQPNKSIPLEASWIDAAQSAILTPHTDVNHLVEIDQSTSMFKFKGGISGGTLGTAVTIMEEVPKEKVLAGQKPYALCPDEGPPLPPSPYVFRLPFTSSVGGFFGMAPVNKALVNRTWSLLEMAREDAVQNNSPRPLHVLSYGPNFKYQEFMGLPNPVLAWLLSALMYAGNWLFTRLAPLQWLFKKLIPPPGTGPSQEEMDKGWLKVTNVTSTTSKPPLVVKSVVKGTGDPGYSLTAVMIAESALSILFSHDSLPAFGQQGGILTPVSALGEVLVSRLEKSGRFQFESGILDQESRKNK